MSALAPKSATNAHQVHMKTLKKRADFLRLRDGKIQKRPGFFLQAAKGQEGEIRAGFTCSKKVGNAVTRNRAKRRLREVARVTLPLAGKAGWDYVFVGRVETTVKREFAKLLKDAEGALRDLGKEIE